MLPTLLPTPLPAHCLPCCLSGSALPTARGFASCVREQAVAFTPDGHPDKAGQVSSLGVTLHSRFEQLGDPSDLDRCIRLSEQAVALTPDGHPHKPSRFNNLGSSLLSRFEKLGDLSDLDRAIHVSEQALALTSDGHPSKPSQFNNLGNSLLSRFKHLGDSSDLNKCIQLFEQTLALTADGHLDKPSRLNNLGLSLYSRFEHLGDLSDLNRSIQLFEQAVSPVPDRHSNKSSRFNNLGHSLYSRFEQLGDLSDLNRSTQAKEQALALTPDGHPDKPSRFNTLGLSLRACFEQSGDLSDLKRSIQLFEMALALTPDGHPDKPSQLINLGSSLLYYSEQLGDLSDLNRSIQVKEQALALTPDGHPDKPSRFSSLGSSLLSRFKQLGDMSDLNRSIQVEEQALTLTPDGHPDKPSQFNNLGNSLLSRFEQLGDLSDLNRSIHAKEQALAFTPDGHPNKSSRYSNLGNSLHSRFEQLGDLSDLNRSIQVKEQALALTPDGHFDKSSRCSNLGLSLYSRFKKLGDLSDLNKSIQLFEQTVALTPDGHSGKPSRFNNLGLSLHTRFKKLGDLSDLYRSIQFEEQALVLTPEGHPDKPSLSHNLGSSLLSQFQYSASSKSLHSALSHFASAANSISGPSSLRFHAATVWMSYAQSHAPNQAMESCQVAMTLIPQLLQLGASIPDWHHQIKSVGSAARVAAGVAITAKQYNTALEWLEQGRSIVWNQLLQLRSPLDRLQQVYPHLASEFQFLSLQLERSTTHTVSDNQLSSPIWKDYHELAQKHQTLLQDIRQKPGFERFLLHKTVSELLPAADKGPIVVLNLSKQRVDALVLHRKLGVLHVPLPGGSSAESYNKPGHTNSSISGSISSLVKRLESEDVDPTTSNKHPDLAAIWCLIVCPVLNILEITTPMSPGESVRRIWWCPTGPLTALPIHAAGIYPNGPKLSEYVVSSYTPTISALLDENHARPVIPPRLLIISLPNEANLPGTQREVECIANHAQNVPISIQSLREDAAIPRTVSEEMVRSEWAHFACHGMQDTKDPTQSSLQLAKNSRLSLSDILKLRLERAQFAFLSACQTATGDEKLEDEAVHLAAGMLLAGYRGVIATMRSVNDQYAADIADDTYRRLFNDYGGDFTRAAEALHFAVQKVRSDREAKGDFSFAWVPFIHMGA